VTLLASRGSRSGASSAMGLQVVAESSSESPAVGVVGNVVGGASSKIFHVIRGLGNRTISLKTGSRSRGVPSNVDLAFSPGARYG
jgi:hypothetical protein